MTKENKRKGGVAKVCVTGALVAGLSVACIPGAIAYSTEKTEAVELAAEQKVAPAEYEKTEVVYATLSATGATKGVYVVNQFDVSAAGAIEDFGTYSTVANLTDQGALKYADGATSFEAAEGAFYYQGSAAVDSVKLPWNVAISYTLDGAAISPDDVAGKSGELGIHLTTSRAEGVDAAFADSYMLQITLTLNGDTATDIVAEGATIASAGRDRTIAFTALPGKNADCALTAKVSDFEMAGIQIAALPYSMIMEMPETDEMTEGIGELSGAISQLNEGAEELASGVSELSSGAAELSSGSTEFGDGLAQLNSNAGALVEGSAKFDAALKQIAQGLEGFDAEDLAGLDSAQLASYLESTAGALENVASKMSNAYGVYHPAYSELSITMGNLKSALGAVSEKDLVAVKEAVKASSSTDVDASASELFDVYNAANSVSSVYGNGSAFAAADAALAQFAENGEMSNTINQAVGLLNSVASLLKNSEEVSESADQIVALVEGLKQLADGYGQFHQGLVSFANGLDQLNSNYGELNDGMAQLASGVSELDGGTSEFAAGISELNSVTIDLPATMRAEIEKMMEEYDFPEFDPISFVDDRNDERMVAVQFVLTTDAISVEEPEVEVEEEEVDQNIVDRFLALFE